jgi:hypothetical protein
LLSSPFGFSMGARNVDAAMNLPPEICVRLFDVRAARIDAGVP